MLTAVIGFLLMALFLTAVRAGRDAIRGERFQVFREHRAVGVTASLADGLALLRTGEPPTDPYECVVTQTDDDANTYDCKVTFTNTGALQYDVTAEPATDTDMATLPAMPGNF